MTMMNMDLLKRTVYGPNATNDDRFTWEEITPADVRKQPRAIKALLKDVEVTDDHWSDYRRYKITGCTHKHRDQGVCDTCGDEEV